MELAEVVIGEIQSERSNNITHFLLKALVNPVSRRQCIRSVWFCFSIWDVVMRARSGIPLMIVFSAFTTSAGEYLDAASLKLPRFVTE